MRFGVMAAAAAALVCAGQAEAQTPAADFIINQSFGSSYALHGSSGYAFIPPLDLAPLQFVRSATLSYQVYASYSPVLVPTVPGSDITATFTGSAGFQLLTPDIVSVSVPYSSTLDCTKTCMALIKASGNLAIPSQEFLSFTQKPYTIFTAVGGISLTSITASSGSAFVLDTADFGNYGASGTISYVIGTSLPEPATWATMVAGLGAIGGLMRRRSRPRHLPVS